MKRPDIDVQHEIADPDSYVAGVLAERERCWQICNEYRQPKLTAVDVIAARIKSGKRERSV